MTTTAEDPITEKPTTTDPAIDVELPTSPVRRTRPTRPVVRPASRRTRVTVRRFGLLSVFKFSLIFSFCVMVVVWLVMTWWLERASLPSLQAADATLPKVGSSQTRPVIPHQHTRGREAAVPTHVAR